MPKGVVLEEDALLELSKELQRLRVKAELIQEEGKFLKQDVTKIQRWLQKKARSKKK